MHTRLCAHGFVFHRVHRGAPLYWHEGQGVLFLPVARPVSEAPVAQLPARAAAGFERLSEAAGGLGGSCHALVLFHVRHDVAAAAEWPQRGGSSDVEVSLSCAVVQAEMLLAQSAAAAAGSEPLRVYVCHCCTDEGLVQSMLRSSLGSVGLQLDSLRLYLPDSHTSYDGTRLAPVHQRLGFHLSCDGEQAGILKCGALACCSCRAVSLQRIDLDRLPLPSCTFNLLTPAPQGSRGITWPVGRLPGCSGCSDARQPPQRQHRGERPLAHGVSSHMAATCSSRRRQPTKRGVAVRCATSSGTLPPAGRPGCRRRSLRRRGRLRGQCRSPSRSTSSRNISSSSSRRCSSSWGSRSERGFF